LEKITLFGPKMTPKMTPKMSALLSGILKKRGANYHSPLSPIIHQNHSTICLSFSSFLDLLSGVLT
jgi:hypothetical protein